MVRIAICDDDEMLCHGLEEMIEAAKSIHGGDIILEVFSDGEELCRYMKQGNFLDVIFLDIEMGKVDGISAGHEIREVLNDDSVQIIYISSKDSYAMELFSVRPMNFLIKPISEEKLKQALSQVYRLLKKDDQMYEYKINRQSYYISMMKIQYFQVINRKIIIHTSNGEVVYYGKISEVIEKVKRQRFLMINRSELVNYNAIEMYQKDKIRLYSGEELQIVKSRQKEIQEQMLTYAKEDM